MNHNPYNLKVGDEVILDNDLNSKQVVYIHEFTPQHMWATVYTKSIWTRRKTKWTVMTYRLSPC